MEGGEEKRKHREREGGSKGREGRKEGEGGRKEGGKEELVCFHSRPPSSTASLASHPLPPDQGTPV